MKVYNLSSFTNQRFLRAVIAGLVTALACAIVYALFTNLIHIEFSIIYIGVGYLIGTAIRYFGHGVKLKFRILGIICSLIFIFLADTLYYTGFQVNLIPMIIIPILRSYASLNINSLLGLLFRGVCVYYAYLYASVV